MAEFRPFKMHDNLLDTVIRAQTGSVDRAVMELVANAIDARATRVDIVLSADAIDVVDDGRGFADRDEVERTFETFGRPHEADEGKVFGAFRMGRGQLFNYGECVWESNGSRMRVDLRSGCGYEYSELSPPVAGCRVRVVRSPDRPTFDPPSLARALRKALAWTDIPVTVDGEQVSRPPAAGVWDLTRPEGYVLLTGGEVETVYDRGLHVTDVRRAAGFGAVIVARRPLALNFARNQVLDACPTFAALRAATDAARRTVLADRAKLSPPRLAARWRASVADGLPPDVTDDLPLFRDATGRPWTPRQLRSNGCGYARTLLVVPPDATPAERKAAAAVTRAGLAVALDGRGWDPKLVRRTVLGDLRYVFDAVDPWGPAALPPRAALVAAGTVPSVLGRRLTAAERVGLERYRRLFGVVADRTACRRPFRTVASVGGEPVWSDGWATVGVRRDWLAAAPADLAAAAAFWCRASEIAYPTGLGRSDGGYWSTGSACRVIDRLDRVGPAVAAALAYDPLSPPPSTETP